jgi:hypothetical protein
MNEVSPFSFIARGGFASTSSWDSQFTRIAINTTSNHLRARYGARFFLSLSPNLV